MLKAVIFDVDFTLARPGPELGPEGYRKVGERHGLDLDPALYEQSRQAALDSLQRHPDHDHDDELWIAFTEQIVRGMGGDARAHARAPRSSCAPGSSTSASRSTRTRSRRSRSCASTGSRSA